MDANPDRNSGRFAEAKALEGKRHCLDGPVAECRTPLALWGKSLNACVDESRHWG